MRNPEFGSEKEPDVYHQAERFKNALDKLNFIRQTFFIERGTGVNSSEEEQNKMFQNFELQFIEHILQLVDVSKLDWHPVPEDQEHMENDASGDLIIEPKSYTIIRGENSAMDKEISAQSDKMLEYSVHNGLIEEIILDVNVDLYDEERSGSHPTGLLYPSKHEINDEPASHDHIRLDGYKSKILADVIEYVVQRLDSIYNDPRWHINMDTNNPGKYVIEEI